LVPMAAAIWSARPNELLEFPAHFLIGFFQNHGLLQVRDQPQWKTITGGARNYVKTLIEPFQDRIHLNCAVDSVTRHEDKVVVASRNKSLGIFDQVVFATHADDTLAMLTDANGKEREILKAFPYQDNEAVIHTDCSLLPRRRRARASWNYHKSRQTEHPVALTYDLSRLQNIDSPSPLLLTLNHSGRIDASKVLRRINYSHPAYGCAAIDAQARHAEISGRRRTHYCGAYWGYGFHEDGVNSALAVAKHFGIGLEACTVASTKDKLSTVALVQ
jgi:predicted NAD/FAD-binding protein